MPHDPFPPRWHEVVRANFERTTGLVVAQTGNCLTIQRDEQHRVTGRRFRPVSPADLATLELGKSWFIGVLLCPGDGTDRLAEWAARLAGREVWRIRFYHVPDVDLRAALKSWRDRGLPTPSTFPLQDFPSFHKLYGRHFGDVVYRDSTRPIA